MQYLSDLFKQLEAQASQHPLMDEYQCRLAHLNHFTELVYDCIAMIVAGFSGG